MVQYIGIDKERYDAGNKFLSQDPYLQNYQNKAAITFNPSNSNTGIMSAYPKPIIPMYDGGDGGDGPVNPRGPGYGYTSPGGNLNPDGSFKNIDDFAEGTIPEEDMPKGPGLSLMDMVRAGGAYMFGGPLNMMSSLNKSNKRNELNAYASDEEIDEINKRINEQYGTISDESGSTDYGGTGYEGMTDAQSDQERSEGGRGKRADGGRAGYKDGGYSSEDNEEQQAQDQASFDAGNRTDAYNDMYSGDGGNPPPSYSTNEPLSNLNFSLVKDVNPAFSYANNFGKFGGVLDTTKTIEEEEPVGTMGYFSPSNNFGIGFDTDLGMVGKANLGNLNIGYTGKDGFNANYMGNFAGDAGRFGANYNKDGFGLGLTFNKKFNNGGIVGLYR